MNRKANTKFYIKKSLGLVLVLLLPSVAAATIPQDGYLMATKECPALHSIKKNTNPGNIHLKNGALYQVKAKNKPRASHYQIIIEGQQKKQRWVSVSCGKFLVEGDCDGGGADSGTAVDNQTEKEYLLALSWQPAFCQTHQQKAECISQTEDRFDAANLSLHGLWPQPKSNTYCNVSNKNKTLDRRKHWHLLPELNLNDRLFEQLLIVMPGVASFLQRHEWIKHGTCYNDNPAEYFEHALNLTEQINDSQVKDLFVSHINKRLSASRIKKAFDDAFGAGAGAKVNVKCDNKSRIAELWINLKGKIDDHTPLGDLLKNAEATQSQCSRGLVDPAGF